MHFLALAAAAVAFVAPPVPGPKGLEGVPIPQVPTLAAPKALHAGQTIDGIKCELSEKVAFHIHAHLAIFVNGKQRQVPALWGLKLSTTQVGPAHGKVTALVNGKVWNGRTSAIPLADHSLIQLDVGTPLVGEQKVGFAQLA